MLRNEENPDCLGKTRYGLEWFSNGKCIGILITQCGCCTPVYRMGRVDWDLQQTTHTEQWNFCFPLSTCFIQKKVKIFWKNYGDASNFLECLSQKFQEDYLKLLFSRIKIKRCVKCLPPPLIFKEFIWLKKVHPMGRIQTIFLCSVYDFSHNLRGTAHLCITGL